MLALASACFSPTAPLYGSEQAVSPELGATALVVGGHLTRLGLPRLVRVDSRTGQPVGTPVAVTGVRAALFQGDHLYLGGRFERIGDISSHNLARLQATGGVDPAWQCPVVGEVLALAADEEHLYLAGRFDHVGGLPRTHLARARLTDGTVDPTWAVPLDGPVHSLALTPDAVLIGGAFMTIDGLDAPRLARIAKRDGVMDPRFVTGADAEVRSLMVDGDHLLVGGFFTRIGDQDRHGLARLRIHTGDVDPQWKPSVDGVVTTLHAAGADLFIGGLFSGVDGAPRHHAAVLDLRRGSLREELLDADGPVTAFVGNRATGLIVAGGFGRLAGRSAGAVVRLSPEVLVPDAAWATDLTGDQEVTCLAHAGSVLLVGASPVQGETCGPVTGLLTSGQPSGWRPRLEGSRPTVIAGLRQDPYLYLGGNFAEAAGRRRQHLARFLAADGSLDRTWVADADGTVRSIIPWQDGLVVGGDFHSINGVPTPYLARIRADGTVEALAASPDGPVFAMIGDAAGLLIGGAFRTLGGQAAIGLGRLTPDGQRDPGFHGDLHLADGQPGTCLHLAALGAGRVSVGGEFLTCSGRPTPWLAWIHRSDGSVAGTPPAPDGPVRAQAVTAAGLVVGGSFQHLGGQSRNRTGQVGLDGSLLPWRVDADRDVHAVTIDGRRVWLGGDFTRLGGQDALRLGWAALADGTPGSATGADDRILLLLSPTQAD